MPLLRAVLFDLWNTLIVDDPAANRQCEQLRARTTSALLAELGFTHSGDDVLAAFQRAGQEHGRMHDGELDLSARGRTVMYLRQLDEAMCDGFDDRAWRLLDDAVLTPKLRFRPLRVAGAREALKSVKALGLPVGLISNAGITPGFVLRQILDELEMLSFFDLTVFSDEAELAKPARAIFDQALEDMGVAAAEAAFVGDQPRLDVLGARRAGMWSVQFGDLTHDGITPHARIASLDELLPALRSLPLAG